MNLWLEIREMFGGRRQDGLHQTESVQAVFKAGRALMVTRGGPLVGCISMVYGYPVLIQKRLFLNSRDQPSAIGPGGSETKSKNNKILAQR